MASLSYIKILMDDVQALRIGKARHEKALELQELILTAQYERIKVLQQPVFMSQAKQTCVFTKNLI